MFFFNRFKYNQNNIFNYGIKLKGSKIIYEIILKIKQNKLLQKIKNKLSELRIDNINNAKLIICVDEVINLYDHNFFSEKYVKIQAYGIHIKNRYSSRGSPNSSIPHK